MEYTADNIIGLQFKIDSCQSSLLDIYTIKKHIIRDRVNIYWNNDRDHVDYAISNVVDNLNSLHWIAATEKAGHLFETTDR